MAFHLTISLVVLLLSAGLSLLATTGSAVAAGHGNGRNGNGSGDGMMGSGEDQALIRSLVDSRDQIERTVEETEHGIESYTRSANPDVAQWIIDHVNSMKARIESNNPIRLGDPLFAAVFNNTDHLEFSIAILADGVKVSENGTTPCAMALVKAHAHVVSAFIDLGEEETKLKHEVPDACSVTTSNDVKEENDNEEGSGATASTRSLLIIIGMAILVALNIETI